MKIRLLALTTTSLVLALAIAGNGHAVGVSKAETKCAAKVAGGAAKLAQTVVKETSKCRDADISGKSVGSCPAAKGTAKIAKAVAKLESFAAKSCGSKCLHDPEVNCLADSHCPPLTSAQGKCNDGGTSSFDIGNIGYDGWACRAILGRDVNSTDDIAACVASTVREAGDNFVAAVYGSTNNASNLPKTAARCLSKAGKMANKLMGAVAKGVTKCRIGIMKGKVTGDPGECATADAKVANKIGKMEQKLRSTLAKSCTASTLVALDICGQGLGAVTTTDDAGDCLTAAAKEVADGQATPLLRTYSNRSVIDGAFASEAVCGDGVINQLRSVHLRVGEECDGDDDDACPGQCLPPGDMFECTCGDIPRFRAFKYAEEGDSDAGWNGMPHNQEAVGMAGYVLDMSNCDCTEFDGATCVGESIDQVCDLQGQQLPVCSHTPGANETCDATGNANGQDEHADCWVCDSFNSNAGENCTNESDCQAQCHDSSWNPTGATCSTQADCPAGQVCRGQCDRSQTCLVITEGAPLPVVSSSTAACTYNAFRTNVTGTLDIVTGEFDIYYEQRTVAHLADSTTIPCPVCGGFCDGGSKRGPINLDGEICLGTCSVSGDDCRLDTDCSEGEYCTDDSGDCPGGFCNLTNVCSAGERDGQACSMDFQHPVWGSTAADCMPRADLNISGAGLWVYHDPATSGYEELTAEIPCTAGGYELYDCHCPDDGGEPTKPNTCAAACNAGPNLGQGCATASSPTGTFTTCVGGDYDGRACDEDSDCSGGACSGNPLHCVGDNATAGAPCSSDGDCGSGVCEDACPDGRCVPLCLPDSADPEEGRCVAGPPFYLCESGKYAQVACLPSLIGAGCDATCTGSGTACTSQDDCGDGESCEGPCPSHTLCEAGPDGVLGNFDDRDGAGACVGKPRSCHLPTIFAEGGSTLNGDGDPTNFHEISIWCFPATGMQAIDDRTGLGGPGRHRGEGFRVMNVDSIPAD